ncbi:MAG TPA: chromosome partitioning protein [Cyanobacteria bacterium UBA8803]|nr:chromosome partitioning protein [Cyanobacteria bacterium UBA9273]HBL62369.1 chromosome partitioning protein [Cyanobacteria bacterium UBA8803]
MSITIVAFFNNKGGVGTTSLVYHLAWMYSDLGFRVVAADLDPQANLTSAFLDEDRLEELWLEEDHPNTVFGCVQPLVKGIGDIADPYMELVGERIALLVGDLLLAGFEDDLSSEWSGCLDRQERSFRVISAFWRMMQKTAIVHQADVILLDLGPNLGAINRSALVAADYVVVPLSPDLFSLQGLRNLGPTLRRWRYDWQERLGRNPAVNLTLPTGRIQPIGYIVLQHSVRLDRPVKAYNRWIAQIPIIYRDAVLNQPEADSISVANDPNSLALLKNYQSLMAMAQEARKPIFHLKAADGAIGSHSSAVKNVYDDFKKLAYKIAERTEIKIS